MTENRKKAIQVEGNPHVNREVLERAAQLNKELERHGLSTEQGYRIAPALGGEILRDSPRRDQPEERGTSAWNVSPEVDG